MRALQISERLCGLPVRSGRPQGPSQRLSTLGIRFPDKIPPTKSPRKKKNYLHFSVATLFRFVARFARVRIEDFSLNRFVLNGIQRDFFGRIFSGGFFWGDFIWIPYFTYDSFLSIVIKPQIIL